MYKLSRNLRLSYIGILLFLGIGCSKPIIKEHIEYIPVPAIAETLTVHDTTRIEGYKVIKGDTVLSVQYRDRKIYVKVKPDTLRIKDVDTLTYKVTVVKTDWTKTIAYASGGGVLLVLIILFFVWRIRR